MRIGKKLKYIGKAALLLTLSFALAFVNGCGAKNAGNDGKDYTKMDYPIKTDSTLTIWTAVDPSVNYYGTNLAQTPLYQELMKKTGIKVEFKHPPLNQFQEQFNLMIASGDLTDIIYYNFINFSGGPEKAINENIIIDYTDLLNAGAIPNLKVLLDSDKELDKMVKTDNKQYYSFPFIRGDEFLMVFMGPLMRKDFLEELNLDIPETIEEWENVLTVIKNKKGIKNPLVIRDFFNTVQNTSIFAGAFGVMDNFYAENGKIIYGPIEQGYKQYLELMHNWFSKGLLDKDFATTDKNTADTKFLTNKSAATVGYAGSTIGTYLDTMKDKDNKFDIVALNYPTLNKGEKPKFGQYSPKVDMVHNASISAKCQNPTLAARFLDYGYGEEGHMLFNFGVEGVSYEMIDGYPTYTDLIKNNPEGLTMNQAMGGYMRSQYGGTFVQDRKYMEQYSSYQQQKDAIKVWANTDTKKYLLPPVTPSTEESNEFARIMNEVTTYKEEMVVGFIMGQISLDRFDEYVAQIKSMNIDKAIEIMQNSLSRYNNR